MTRKEKILAFMRSKQYVPLKFQELRTVLDVPPEEENELLKILEQLKSEGKILKSRRDRYLAADQSELKTGKYSGSARGFGFVSVEGEEDDLFIPNENTGGAMHGDQVLVKVSAEKSENRRAEGRVIKVLQRANKKLICSVLKKNRTTLAVPDNKYVWQNIHIHPAHTLSAQKGQKVVVELIRYPKENRDAEGNITEILGWEDAAHTTNLGVMRTYGLKDTFPEEVMEEIKNVPDEISSEDMKNRKDLRGECIITIDGEDAKDLDDAVAVKMLENGNYLLSVHIADVSNYVRPGSALFQEAISRGTSVYLAGTVIPMLPPKLSNGICSLNENQKRLTLSVDMEITPKGEIKTHEIYQGVIQTSHRMTYTDVTKILGGNRRLQKQYADILEMLRLMRKLAKLLRKNRMKEGSIDFNFPETKLQFDDAGNVYGVAAYDYTISNQIIEEFMLCANKTVAEAFYWMEYPFVYRIHETPSEEKMTELLRLLRLFGQNIKGNTEEIHPKALQQVLEAIKEEPYARVIGTVMLRSMMKARYSTNNQGHFGLAAKYYCHFTSPIRRLADLAIHSIIKEWLNGKLDEKTQAAYTEIAEIAAKSASSREVVAEEAERLSIKLKIAEYMSSFIGEEFDGIISSIVSSGFYVELENTVEGRVGLADMEDDYYEYIPDSYSLMGRRTGKSYHIGDAVKIQLARADKITGEIDFVLA